MLSAKQASPRLTMVRNNRIKIRYLSAEDAYWLDIAGRLLELFRGAQGLSRGELQEELTSILGDSAAHAVHQGLVKLLEDRCDFEMDAGFSPTEVRAAIFQTAAELRQQDAFDRERVFAQVGEAFQIPPDQVEQSMFADLKTEQRLIRFRDCTPTYLLHRYNEALAQAVILKAVRVEVNLPEESPARYRQLFRAIKFHRLICDIHERETGGYRLELDGPLSLFSATQKYGLQMALFLPHLLQCRTFDLRALVRWGPQRKEKVFLLDSSEGLQSHLPDYGSWTPPDLLMFVEQFAKSGRGWTLDTEPGIVALGKGVWVPDFQLHPPNRPQPVYLEVLGFWRKTAVLKHLERLKEAAPGPYILAVSEQLHTDASLPEDLEQSIYQFKRTPLVEEVIRRAEALLASQPSLFAR